MSYYYYYETDSEYTVFKSHPIHNYLSIFLSKIFFLESDIVENNQQKFEEVYDLFNDEELKKFDFISVSDQPKQINSLILSELNMSTKLTAEDLNHLKQFQKRKRFEKSEYSDFLASITDLFGFKNIHEGGLLWFEPYIHGYKVKFMSAKKFITDTKPKNLKGMILDNCNMETVIKKFNIEVENNKKEFEISNSDSSTEKNKNKPDLENSDFRSEIPSLTAQYSEFLERINEIQNADFETEIDIREINTYLNTLVEAARSDIRRRRGNRRGNRRYKLEIRDNDGIYEIHVPNIEEEITMTPVAKSFYFLTLLIQDGIRFEELMFCKQELYNIYSNLSDSENPDNMERTLDNISINTNEVATQKSRARRGFRDVVCPEYEMLCEEIIQELVYVQGTRDLIIKLSHGNGNDDDGDILGHRNLFDMSN